MTAPDDTATDLHAVIAELRSERDAALSDKAALAEELAAQTVELAERKSEFGERIAQQAATIDVLKVMSASPGDPQPVFDLIVRRATELCNGLGTIVFELDGGLVHYRASYFTEALVTVEHVAYAAAFPCAPTRGSISCRAILDREIVHIRDTDTDLELSQVARELHKATLVRSQISVPLMRNGQAIGAISLAAIDPGGFSDSQIELLKTFAEQAMIAITSAETYRTLQTRTTDLQQSLEYQTATSDVLKVISRSTFDLQPVLDTVAETAGRLCDADQAAIFRREGDLIRFVTNCGFPPEYEAHLRGLGTYAFDPYPQNVTTRAIREGRTVHINDVALIPGYAEQAIRLGKQRTSLGVPLLREGEAIGVIVLARQRVEPFTDRQIELVSTFADQAVIAIENTRLLTEQQEALEQQTAAAEVLQVINASPGDLVPVFDAILEKAHTLCEAEKGSLNIFDGEHFRAVATHGLSPEYAAMLRAPQSKPPGSPPDRLLRGETIVQVADASVLPFPIAQAATAIERVRTILYIPLRKNITLVGYITVYRQEVRAFTGKQITLLQNFAAQAVIAMDNARLLTEQREALERQTATAEVLQVINANPGNLAPVFDAMLQKAMRLCEASFGSLWTLDGDRFRPVAHHGLPPAYAEFLSREVPAAGPGTGRARLLTGAPYTQILDLANDEPYRNGEPHRVAIVDVGGARTALLVSLRRDDAVLGLFMIYRKEVRPFTDKQIALLENFAAQAVIAMENARLLTETREALEQQTATAEVLGVINASPGSLAPVFDAILHKAHSLCGAAIGALAVYDGEFFRAFATLGYPEQHAILMRQPYPPNHYHRQLLRGDRIVHIPDVKANEFNRDDDVGRSLRDRTEARTGLAVPLCKDGLLLGYISAFRREVRLFSEKEIALLENFAAQAVIAMENARLLNEQREALEQQTGTAEVLQVINSSPGDLAPVFDAMLERATRLCEARRGQLATFDGEYFRFVAVHGDTGFSEGQFAQGAARPEIGVTWSRIVAGEEVVQIVDVADTALYRSGHEGARRFVDVGRGRTVLTVALRKDDLLLGALTVYRQEVRSFSDKQIALLRNFAAQAVIAMENARLLTEQREALEQQIATAEVLQVINASPGDLVPVFEAILDKAHGLCGAVVGSLLIYDGERFHAEATHGQPEEVRVILSKPFRPNIFLRRLVFGEHLVHIPDFKAVSVQEDHELTRSTSSLTDIRTSLWVPLRKDGQLLGCISAFRLEVRPFSGREIALLENFAAQAVVAMENARLLNEVRQRQEELRITFENMGDGVALFDETRHLVASNQRFQHMLDVPDDVIASRPTFSDYIRYLADHGEYGPDPEDHVQQLLALGSQRRTFERTRPNGRIIEIRVNPVPGGGFVVIYSDITERKRSEEEIRAARDAAEEASRTIESAYRDLKAAQANLIQAEKMASLGQLTAGIAHEIKNPLNFINNFAELSGDLLDELSDAVAGNRQAEIDELRATLHGNLAKITEHGKRADGIVKAMLEHSRGSSGERRVVDLNALIDEALNLAYHGARAQDQSFNITLERDFAEGIAPIELAPQDMTRVFLNLLSNGFYAVTRRARNSSDAGFMPTLKVTTRDIGYAIEVRVQDNGIGVSADIRDKLFQPFFTTKPTGEGTGLGLSITYDIVTQQHGGTITVDSKVGEYSEFVVRLPRKPRAPGPTFAL